MKDITTLITVVADCQPAHVAADITQIVRDGRPVTVEAVGVAAGEQAMRAAAFAWCRLRAEGIEVACSPSFGEVTVDSQHHPSVKLKVARR